MFAVLGFLKYNTVLGCLLVLVVDGELDIINLLEDDGSVHFLLMGDEES